MQRLATLARGHVLFVLADILERRHCRVFVDALDHLFLQLGPLVRIDHAGESEVKGADPNLEHNILVVPIALAGEARVKHAEAVLLQVFALKRM